MSIAPQAAPVRRVPRGPHGRERDQAAQHDWCPHCVVDAEICQGFVVKGVRRATGTGWHLPHTREDKERWRSLIGTCIFFAENGDLGRVGTYRVILFDYRPWLQSHFVNSHWIFYLTSTFWTLSSNASSISLYFRRLLLLVLRES